MVFDILEDAWSCQAEPPHEIFPRAADTFPDNMLADMKRLGIDPAGDPT